MFFCFRPELSNIGRMFFVNPSNIELLGLRTLLLLRPGAKSYEDLRTIDGIKYNSFREALVGIGYETDDKNWSDLLEEGFQYMTSGDSIRQLFASVLLFCSPLRPQALWEAYKGQLCADLTRKYHSMNYSPKAIEDICLYLINVELQLSGKELKDFMPELQPDYNNLPIANSVKSNLINEEMSYDVNELDMFICQHEPRLNNDQKQAFDMIRTRVDNPNTKGKTILFKLSPNNYFCYKGSNFFFIDGPGGTGKTFLYKLILAYVRKQKKIALAVASSGIASLLLEGGRTAHSRFKIPIDLSDDCACNISVNSNTADLLRESTLIVWDETPMISKKAIQALDITLKDIVGHDSIHPFANKIVIFGGDFRQVLPVVKNGSRAQIVNEAINRSALWSQVTVLKLSINMRVLMSKGQDNQELQEFSEFALRIGNGTEQTVMLNNEPSDYVQLPEKILCHLSKDELVDKIFENLGDR